MGCHRPDGPNASRVYRRRHAYHNACLRGAGPRGMCVDMQPKNRSQGLYQDGATYIAGVWQTVQVAACLDYQFAGYVRTDAPGYHPSSALINCWQCRPRTIPILTWTMFVPHWTFLVPKEHFPYESDMPASIVWSAPML